MDNSNLAEYAKILRQKYPINNKILLVQSLQFQLDAFNIDVAKNKGYYAYPPAGLQCLAKALADRDVEVEIFDLNYHFLKRIIEDDSFFSEHWLDILDAYLTEHQPSIIGVTCIGVSTNVFKSSHPLTSVLQHLRQKDQHVLLAGGPIATDEYENYLIKDLCHFVLEGEGEYKINFLFDYLLDDKPSHTPTTGIYFHYQQAINETEGEHEQVSLEGNLIETYKNIPVEDYHHVGSLNPFSRMAGQDKRFTGIQLNRGCRANCKFCGVPKFMGRGVRQYPSADLCDELVYLIEERGLRHFELLDDDFLGPARLHEGVEALLRHMCSLKEKYDITWAAGNGLVPATISDELLQLIHDSGCIGFRIGIESGNAQMLKRMRKPVSLKALRKFAAMLQKYPRMFVVGNYILGLFGEETFEQILDTYRFSCELEIDWAGFSTYQFTSKATTRAEQLKDDGQGASEFTPSKDISSREIRNREGVFTGPDIFHIPGSSVPSRDQVKEIWFVFNLFANYIDNKNLKPGGDPQKFVAWVEALRVTYPKNPYIALFAGLGCLLASDKESACRHHDDTKTILSDSEYWNYRFTQFNLMDLVFHFPEDSDSVYEMLATLRKGYKNAGNLTP